MPLLKAIVWELCLRFLSSVLSFCKTKGSYYWKHNFYRLCVRNPASGLLQIGQKSEKWQWRHDFPTWRQQDLCQSLFLNKATGLRPATLLKKKLWHRCFPVNFAKFLRTLFLQNTPGRLFLEFQLFSVLLWRPFIDVFIYCFPVKEKQKLNI